MEEKGASSIIVVMMVIVIIAAASGILTFFHFRKGEPISENQALAIGFAYAEKNSSIRNTIKDFNASLENASADLHVPSSL